MKFQNKKTFYIYAPEDLGPTLVLLLRFLPNAFDPFIIKSKDQEVTIEWGFKIPTTKRKRK